VREAANRELRLDWHFGALRLAVLYCYGEQPALEYFTGYLIEKALSVDNLSSSW